MVASFKTTPFTQFNSLGMDALIVLWTTFQFTCSFPKVQILHQMLHKTEQERKTLIIFVPNWPKRNWYAFIYSTQSSRKLSLASSKQDRPSISLPLVPSCFSVTGFKAMAEEIQVLRGRSISHCIISTLLKAKKATFRKICNCT